MPTFAVIGDPIAHSASPRLFAALGQRLGRALACEAVRVAPEALPDAVARLRAGAWEGLSVTIPHKVAALAAADVVAPTARDVGASNCLVRRGRVLEAHNTDVAGIVDALAAHGARLADARVLVVGAGGAARAACAAARAAGCASLHVVNRSPGRAEALARDLGAETVAPRASSLAPVLARANVLLQASAAGLDAPDAAALPDGCVLHGALTVMDMVYRPLETRTLRDARAAGARAVDGLWMLVFQAVAALRLWTDLQVPADVAAAVHAELAAEAMAAPEAP